ncbi:hypothetical protein K525DRAFT_274099 [Schizophyllum commune Loenen D]|nr:hypothetical protein K525DRAFT_274099 [Schizophyllum commune Loenen D]
MSSQPSSASSESPIPTAEHALHEAPSVCTSEQPAVGGKEPDLPDFCSQLAVSLNDQELLERSIANPELLRADAAVLRALAASKTRMWPSDSPEPDYGSREEYKGNVGQYDDLTIVEEPRTPERRGARKGRPRAPSLRSIEDDLVLQMMLQMYAGDAGRQSLRQQAHDRLLLYGALSAMHGSASSEAARALASRPPQASASKPSTASQAGAPAKPSSHAPSESRSLTRKMKQRIRKLTSIDLRKPKIAPQTQRGRVGTVGCATQADPAPQMRH